MPYSKFDADSQTAASRTSSSAIAERPRDACSISNRKPVNFRLKGYVSR